jgi:hypothetical protein
MAKGMVWGQDGAHVVTCALCRYWHRVEVPHDAGVCRRRAPVSTPEPTMRRIDPVSPVSTNAFWGVWPVTLLDDACGEFHWRDFGADEGRARHHG